MVFNKYRITEKVCFKQRLTPQERAYYLLFMATDEEVKEFLAREKEDEKEAGGLLK